MGIKDSIEIAAGIVALFITAYKLFKAIDSVEDILTDEIKKVGNRLDIYMAETNGKFNLINEKLSQHTTKLDYVKQIHGWMTKQGFSDRTSA